MKLEWKQIERIIYIVTILIGVIFFIRDQAKEKAIMETTLLGVSDDIEDIKDKLIKNDEYWRKQMEINGRVITYIELDSSD